MLLRYASVSAAGTELKTIAPPEFAGSADEGICYTYEVNLKNGLFTADELVFLQLEDEEYYFKISHASDIADGSPNTARGKTAESTSGEAVGMAARDTVVATVADSAENRASGDEARGAIAGCGARYECRSGRRCGKRNDERDSKRAGRRCAVRIQSLRARLRRRRG